MEQHISVNHLGSYQNHQYNLPQMAPPMIPGHIPHHPQHPPQNNEVITRIMQFPPEYLVGGFHYKGFEQEMLDKRTSLEGIIIPRLVQPHGEIPNEIPVTRKKKHKWTEDEEQVFKQKILDSDPSEKQKFKKIKENCPELQHFTNGQLRDKYRTRGFQQWLKHNGNLKKGSHRAILNEDEQSAKIIAQNTPPYIGHPAPIQHIPEIHLSNVLPRMESSGPIENCTDGNLEIDEF